MIARTGLLLTLALVVLILLGARELCVANDAQISSTGIAGATGSAGEEILMTSKTGRADEVEDPVDSDGVDLYGNEVTAAVATYQLDGTGTLYEVHSPQTEVPQLAPPKS